MIASGTEAENAGGAQLHMDNSVFKLTIQVSHYTSHGKESGNAVIFFWKPFCMERKHEDR